MSRQDRRQCRRINKMLQRAAAYCTASVSLVATEAGAEIVYTDLGPGGVALEFGRFEVDLNGDTNVDFVIRAFGNSSTNSGSGTKTDFVDVQAVRGRSGVIGDGYASNLVFGQSVIPGSARISPFALLHETRSQFGCDSSECTRETFVRGNFGHGYLGLVLAATEGERNAGWAEVSVPRPGLGFEIFGFAFETEPDKPILAGDTGENVSVPGDANDDGLVDLEDLNAVRNNFGGVGLGDTDGDLDVDLDDLNAVRNHFGGGGARPVPEPPSLVLLAAGAAGLTTLRLRRDRRD